MASWPTRLEQTLLGALPERWQKRLRAAHVGHKQVVRAAAWLTLFVLLAKGIAALKEVAVAYRFGTSAVLEGYLLTFNLGTLPVSLALSIMSAALVPRLVRQQQGSANGGREWQRQVTTWVWVGAVLAALVFWLTVPPLIQAGWLGLGAEGRQAAQAAVPTMAVVTAFGVVAAWHATQLMSRQRHANTLLEATPAASILVAVLLLPGAALDALLWGTGLGFALQLMLLAFIVRAARMPVAPGVPRQWPFDRSLTTRVGWLAAAQALMALGGLVDQVILAHLPPGTLAAFGYANRVMALVLTLSASVLGRALLPVLAGLDQEAARAVARRWAGWMFWLGLVGALLLALAADPVVRLIFERGAFSAQDRVATATLLRWLAMQLPLYLVGAVWVQWLLTQARAGPVLWWAAVAGVLGKLVVSLGLIHGLGWGGEAVCAGLAAATLFVYWVLRRYLKKA